VRVEAAQGVAHPVLAALGGDLPADAGIGGEDRVEAPAEKTMGRLAGDKAIGGDVEIGHDLVSMHQAAPTVLAGAAWVVSRPGDRPAPATAPVPVAHPRHAEKACAGFTGR